MQSMYEYAVMRDMQDKVMRPGGLALTNELLGYCDLDQNSHVLDLGCGCAASLRLVKERYNCNIYGLDISRKLIMQAKGRPCEHCLIQANVNAVPLIANAFDLILLECVVSIFGIEGILSTCRELLKPGGKVLITDLYARKADGLEEVRKFPKGTCIQGIILQQNIFDALKNCQLNVVHWGDYSETMQNFPMKTLSASINISIVDLIMAANSVDLGYYGLIAEK